MSSSIMSSRTIAETSTDQTPAKASAVKQLSIVIPSFKDDRILEAIASARLFDDAGIVRLVIVDGGSPKPLVDAIAAALTPNDILVSERDRGIFDGLNKGLDRVDTPYMGWIGSDDMFTGDIKASEVVAALRSADLFIASMAFFRGDRLRRVTHSWPATRGLGYYGLHNPHYSTFGRSELLKSERFEIDDPISDQLYFFRIFDRKPRAVASASIAVLAGEGGFSNASYGRAMRLNGLLFQAYRSRSNVASAVLGLATKLLYKSSMRLYFKLRRINWPDLYPDAHAVMMASLRARGGSNQP